MKRSLTSLLLLAVAVACALYAWQSLRPRTYDAPLPSKTFSIAPSDSTSRPGQQGSDGAPGAGGGSGAGSGGAGQPSALRPGTDFGPADPCLGQEPTEDDAKANRRCLPSDGRSRLRIPSLGIDAQLVTGRTVDRELFLPHSIYDVAVSDTYAGLDGTTGTVLMSGHVGAGSVPGSLHPLSRISPGATIETSSGKGAPQRWTVTSLQVVDYDKLTVEGDATTPERQLVVVTCGGTWSVHAGKRTYASRVVVTAVPKVD